jgi:hypothetical protein
MFKKSLKFVLVIVFSILLVTVGIDAADNFDNLSESLVGRMFFGKEEGPCPEDMVFVVSDEGESGGFCMDKYEVSASEACPYVDPMNEQQSRENIDSLECIALSKKGAMPWRNVSKVQAMTICAKMGKRLPTASEWFQAALGTPDPSSGWTNEDC